MSLDISGFTCVFSLQKIFKLKINHNIAILKCHNGIINERKANLRVKKLRIQANNNGHLSQNTFYILLLEIWTMTTSLKSSW